MMHKPTPAAQPMPVERPAPSGLELQPAKTAEALPSKPAPAHSGAEERRAREEHLKELRKAAGQAPRPPASVPARRDGPAATTSTPKPAPSVDPYDTTGFSPTP
jgi:hypothetical protein